MVSQKQIVIERRFPVITLIIVFASVMVALVPTWQAALLYQRSDIMAGEWWRLFTGHWVHFSAKHLIYDTTVFGIAGWMIERRGCRNFIWLCVLTPLAIGLSLLFSAPQISVFGGLSGLATAAVVFLALNGLSDRGNWRWISIVALSATALKILFELLSGRFVFLSFTDASITSVPLTHLVGALCALFTYSWSRAASSNDWKLIHEL